jgi:hypothetical protein
MAFLGVGAGVVGMPTFNMASMGPVVASRVRSFPPVGIIAAAPLPPPPLDLAASWSRSSLIWLVRVELEVAREEVVTISFLGTAFLLVAVLARMSRALSMESRRLGLWVLAWAESAWPRLSALHVARRRLALFLWAAR